MKNLFPTFVYLFFAIVIAWGCMSAKFKTTDKTIAENISPDNWYDCELNGNLSPEERRNISLFKIAKKIKVVSFSRKVVSGTPIHHNQIASKYLKDEITLTEDQIDQLTEILYNYNYSKDAGSISFTDGCCYYPRHAIVFLNSNNKTIGYFEFCFECREYQTLPYGENAGVFCPGKYELIHRFFESIGVTFFQEEAE